MVITLPKTYLKKIGAARRGLFELERKRENLIIKLFPVSEEGIDVVSKEWVNFDELPQDIVDSVKEGRKEHNKGMLRSYSEVRKELGLK